MENIKYYPNEIAETLCKLSGEAVTEKVIEECTETLYQLKAIAENPYNSDYYRTLYKVLEKVTEKHE